MTILREVVQVELAILIACFAAILVGKILRGAAQWARHPENRNALRGRKSGGLRLQMLAASLVTALYYLSRLPQSAASGNLPPVQPYALAILAGSQAVFLVGMARNLLRPFVSLKSEGEK